MEHQKTALIDAIYDQLASDEKAKEKFKKEFNLEEKQFEKIVKRMLDIWLNSPEMIMMLSEMLGVYATGEEESVDDGEDADYFG